MPKLIPPDLKQCQCEKKTGSFMTLGPRQMVRCTEKPTVIAYENKPDEDGAKGSMSLCDKHAQKLIEVHGAAFATMKPIKKKKPPRRKK